MNLEIERKYLIDEDVLKKGVDLLTCDPRLYHQAYMCNEPAVRITVRQLWKNGRFQEADKAWITVKGPGSLIREEYEYDIPPEDGMRMMPLGKAHILKTRFHIPSAGSNHLWEVDRYHGSLEGRWVAEVELEDEKDQVLLPEWIGQEVTYDSRFANITLAYQGWPK